jgi:transcription-repair coupling factor (superfamily II helicase)
VRFAPVDLPESRVVRLNRLYPRSIYTSQVGTLLVPRPQATSAAQVLGGRPIDGVALLEWARTVIDTVIDPVQQKVESS